MCWSNLEFKVKIQYKLILCKSEFKIKIEFQESRLSQPDDQSDGQLSPDPTLYFVKQGIPKTEDDWIKLVQRQEVLHQLELEKWHDLLGTATQLLRQVMDSFKIKKFKKLIFV